MTDKWRIWNERFISHSWWMLLFRQNVNFQELNMDLNMGVNPLNYSVCVWKSTRTWNWFAIADKHTRHQNAIFDQKQKDVHDFFQSKNVRSAVLSNHRQCTVLFGFIELHYGLVLFPVVVFFFFFCKIWQRERAEARTFVLVTHLWCTFKYSVNN